MAKQSTAASALTQAANAIAQGGGIGGAVQGVGQGAVQGALGGGIGGAVQGVGQGAVQGALGGGIGGAVAPYLAYQDHPHMQDIMGRVGQVLNLIGHPLAGHFLGTQPGMTAPGQGPVGQSLTGGAPDGQGAQPLYNAGQQY